MKIIAVIPARAGSVRLPNKNIKKLNGIPLITRTIQFAKKLKFINDIVVSTNDPSIIKMNKYNKSIKTFNRPKNLSLKKTKTIDVILHVIKKYEKKFDKVETILLLQPTSPFRSIKKIYLGYQKYKMYKKKKSIVSVSKKNNLNKVNNIKLTYQPNGNFYFASSDFLKKYRSFYLKNHTYKVILNSKFLSIDIDTIVDFKKAEKFLLDEKNIF